MIGLIAAALVVVVGVEALSIGDLIGQGSMLLLSALAVAAGVAAGRSAREANPALAPLDRWERVLVGLLAAVGAITLTLALRAPPNTWDSMTYHVARVAEWYANGNVRFYPTAIDRQLWQPAAAEYLGLAGYGALGGRDWLANLPQWIAGVGSLAACGWLVRLLGGSRRTALLAASVGALLPMAILQASSSQTDLVASLWLLSAAGLVVARVAGRSRPRDALWFGAAIGLAVATKGTALPFGAPLVVAWLAADLARRDWRSAGAGLVAVAGGIAVAAGPQLYRNLVVFGNPLAPPSIGPLLRPASLGPLVILSNAVANLSLHFGTPWPGVNTVLTGAVGALHRLLGLDVHRLYPYFGGFRVQAWSTHEDLAGSPLHVLLAILALGAMAWRWKALDRAGRAYLGLVLAGALLFVLGVRWQPFNTRLTLPMALMSTPAIALWLERRRSAVRVTALAVLSLAALPPLLWNSSRPLLPPIPAVQTVAVRSALAAPRLEQYFVNRSALAGPYRELIEVIGRGPCRSVSLQTGYDSWEYPLWVLGRPDGIRFDPVLQGRVADGDCALVTLDLPPEWRPAGWPAGQGPTWRSGPVALWAPGS